MKISFLLPAYPFKPMGGYKVVYEYANRLMERNYSVTIIYPKNLPNWKSKSIINRVGKKIFNLMLSIYKPKIFWQHINPKINTLYIKEPISTLIPNSDIIFATSWQTAEIIANYPEIKGKKFYLIQDFDSYFGDKERLENTWKLPFKRICVSTWLYEKVIKIIGNNKDTIVIPNGIDHKVFKIINNIEERKKIILMMYYNAPYKSPQIGIDALKIVKKKYTDIKIIIFGNHIRPLSLPFNFNYIKSPTQEELVKLYNTASIFVSSSIAEGFALPPAEAMACGCAVVATDSGGIREYAENENNALLSPPGNVILLAKNIMRLLENDNLRIQIAKQGNNKINEFSWEKSINLLEEFIKN